MGELTLENEDTEEEEEAALMNGLELLSMFLPLTPELLLPDGEGAGEGDGLVDCGVAGVGGATFILAIFSILRRMSSACCCLCCICC